MEKQCEEPNVQHMLKDTSSVAGMLPEEPIVADYVAGAHITDDWSNSEAHYLSAGDDGGFMSPISQLPAELLAQVFAMIDFQPRVQLSLVCKSWDAIARSHPFIWSEVIYDPVDNPASQSDVLSELLVRSVDNPASQSDVLSRILDRSVDCDLRLSVILSNQHADAICTEIQRHLRRCVYLRIHIAPSVSVAQLQGLEDALNQSAPRLRVFKLVDPDRVLALPFSKPIFNSDAPKLHILAMVCPSVAWKWVCRPAFASVRQILWSPTQYIAKADIQELFNLYPLISELHFWVLAGPLWAASEEDSLKLDMPAPLRTVSVVINDGNCLTGAAQFLRTINHTEIQKVSVQGILPIDGDDLLRALTNTSALADPTASDSTHASEPFVPKAASLESSTEYRLNVKLYARAEDGHVPVGFDAGYEGHVDGHAEHALFTARGTLALEPATFAYIVRADLGEMLWSRDVLVHAHALPPMPRLRDLTVFALRTMTHANPEYVSLFVAVSLPGALGPEEHHVLECPALQTLRIAARARLEGGDTQTTITADTLVAFARRCLRYDVEKLQTLMLNGIDLVVVEPADFTEMINVAEEFVFDERPLRWKYSVGRLLNFL
ncbi:hypothetical protein BKA62DRAFT_699246 [Auriculariales sp. MPI-PUGE-AT-0066]|nr:hypothetical protein BKA62DRAFT_699246 [Auriculariales sp. MPI-PUGE-AT-0066]